MSLVVKIFAVGKDNIPLDNQINSLPHNIAYINKVYGTEVSQCDKEEIKKELISFCNTNDVIILIGDISIFPMLKDVAYQAFKDIIDNNISDHMDAFISQLTKELMLSFDRNAMAILKANILLVTQIIYLRSTEMEERRNIENDNFGKNTTSRPESNDKKIKRQLMGLYKKQKESFKVSVKDAINIMRISVRNSDDYKVRIQTVRTNEAYGRILAEHIYSSVQVPSFSASVKRGYAVLDSDGKGTRRVLKAHPTFLEISLVSGTCVRVRSGEPIPKGATAVVTLENTKIIENVKDNDIDYFNIDDMEYEIEVLIAQKKNDNIRDAGCRIDCDEHILERFTRLGPAELGILTLCGIDSIEIVKLPSIGLLSIGNELEEPGNIFTLGRIVDSNRITMSSLLKENGYNSIDFGISPYLLSEMIKKIKMALDKVNVLVIMGRANNKDLLKPILKECFQAYIYFGCVDMKPGKSTTFAVNTYNGKRKFFLCMSANPATVSIVAHVLFVPLLNELRYNCFAESIIVQTRMKDHKLHVRPKFSWTTLHWTETEMYPTAYCPKNQLQNVKYQKAKAFNAPTAHVARVRVRRRIRASGVSRLKIISAEISSRYF